MMTADQQRTAEAEGARNRRVEGYASWLADDVDGIIFNVMPRDGAAPCPSTTTILAQARATVALALSKIDLAIAKDKEAHSQEPA